MKFALLIAYVMLCLVVDAMERVWAVLFGEIFMRVYEKIRLVARTRLNARRAGSVGRVLIGIAIVTVATWLGLVYRDVVALSRASASADDVRNGRVAANYDVSTLHWSTLDARTVSVTQGRLEILTGDGPYLYDAVARVPVDRAAIAHLTVRGYVGKGGITIGLMAGGKWLGFRSFQSPGPFEDLVTGRLAGASSLDIVVANCNPAGESAAALDDLKLYVVR